MREGERMEGEMEEGRGNAGVREGWKSEERGRGKKVETRTKIETTISNLIA